MINDFLKYQAQTTPFPIGLEITKAKGSYIYDSRGRKYLDFVAGVSACSVGHRHPAVIRAMKRQMNKHLHVMVYGEFAQKNAVEYAKALIDRLAPSLEQIYLTNSGTEAIEGALKLAKRASGRSEIIAAHQAYHGSTQGALSLLGIEEQKAAYRPLLPGVRYIQFNDFSALEKINDKTAAVILETIQGGAGFIVPEENYLQRVAERCKAVGALLILDEIQPGFGRTGRWFAYEDYGIVPDILVMGKGMAGGMPVGAFAASQQLMSLLTNKPALGHITTFGGNPVIAAACLATLKTIEKENLMGQIAHKEALFRELLVHPLIEKVNGKGLMLAPILKEAKYTAPIVEKALEKGLILFFLLWEKRAIRISPPLTISTKEIRKGCKILLECLDEVSAVN